MDNYEVIKNAINYSENNLTNDISVIELSNLSGYSVYHFCRLFQNVVGCGPMEYIRKRRLSNAAIEIASDQTYIKDIGFKWGFNSHENFIRAFRNQFGISPSQYRKIRSSLNLYHKYQKRIIQNYETPKLNPRFLAKPYFKIAGFKCDTSFENNSKANDVPQHWNNYHAQKLYEKIGVDKNPSERWDIGLITDYNQKNGNFSYIIGIEVDDFKYVNNECEKITVPSAQYVVFNTPPSDSETFVSTIHMTWDYIKMIWLPQSGFEYVGANEFETYCEESHTYSEEIWIPIGR